MYNGKLEQPSYANTNIKIDNIASRNNLQDITCKDQISNEKNIKILTKNIELRINHRAKRFCLYINNHLVTDYTKNN